jgi:PKD repeat protein
MTVVTLTSGTSWLVPARCLKISVTLCGGGAGGTGGVYDGFDAYGGTTGGVSTSQITAIDPVTPGNYLAYSVGAGGAGGTGYYDTPQIYYGGNGGTTTFEGATSSTGGVGRKLLNASRTASDGTNGPIAGGSSSAGSGTYPFYGAAATGYGASGGGGDGYCTFAGCNGGAGASGVIVITYTLAPDATFTKDKTSGNAPLTVAFTNTSTNGVSYLWRFGTGEGTSTDTSPSHQYVNPGVYTVTLEATNTGGTTISAGQTVTVNAVTPVANFTPVPSTGNAPLFVTFTDTSTNYPTSWKWVFGDGITINDTLQNPTHTYAAGTWSAKLTATNSAGDDDITKTITSIGAPAASFNVRPKSLVHNVSYGEGKVKLFDRSSYSGSGASSWDWRLSATGMTTLTSTLQNPEIELPVMTGATPTIYWTVSLFITNTANVRSAGATIPFSIIQRYAIP